MTSKALLGAPVLMRYLSCKGEKKQAAAVEEKKKLVLDGLNGHAIFSG